MKFTMVLYSGTLQITEDSEAHFMMIHEEEESRCKCWVRYSSPLAKPGISKVHIYYNYMVTESAVLQDN